MNQPAIDRAASEPIANDDTVLAPVGPTSTDMGGSETPITPAEESGPPAILALSREILQEIRSLGGDFNTKLKYDQSKDRTIDALHTELQQARQGLGFNLLRPILVDLISLYDDLVGIAASLDKDAQAAPSHILRSLTSFAGTVEEILSRNGVTMFTSEDDAFDSKRQRASGTVATTDPQLANKVAQRMRKGFEYDGRVLRPEFVVAYRLVTDSLESTSAEVPPRPEDEGK